METPGYLNKHSIANQGMSSSENAYRRSLVGGRRGLADCGMEDADASISAHIFADAVTDLLHTNSKEESR